MQLLEAMLKESSNSTTKSAAQQEPGQSNESGKAQSDAVARKDSPNKSGFRKTSVGESSFQC